jgi:predicted nucleic acid-binding protein
MPLLVDTGVLYALADRSDAWHDRVSAYFESTRATLLAPVTVLPEVTYLLRQRLGISAEQAFVESLSRGEIAIEDLKRRDWPRIEQIMTDYDQLGFVDASIVALSERLKARELATTDRRHFGVVRPAHLQRLQLVP